MFVFCLSYSVFHIVKLFAWGWLYVPLMRNSHLLCLVALSLGIYLQMKDMLYWQMQRDLCLWATGFPLQGKGFSSFLWMPSRDQNKICIKTVSMLHAPFKTGLILSVIHSPFQEFIQLNCNNIYGSFWQTFVIPFTYYTLLPIDTGIGEILLESYVLFFCWDFPKHIRSSIY